MSVTEVQNEIKKLSRDELEHLASFVSAQRKLQDPQYQETLRARREKETNWISLDEMKRGSGRV